MPCLGEQAPALGLGTLDTNVVVAEVDVSDGRGLLEGRSQCLEKGCCAQANKHRLWALAHWSPRQLFLRSM